MSRLKPLWVCGCAQDFVFFLLLLTRAAYCHGMLTSDTELSEGEGCSCKTDGQLWALLLRQFRKELARALVCEFAGSTAGGLASRQCQGLKKRMTPAALLLTVIARRSMGAPSSMAQSSVRVFDCMDLQSLHLRDA